MKPECFIKGNFKVILEKDKITYKGGYFKELMISLSEVEGVFPDLDTIYPDYKNEYKGQAENIAFNPHYFADISKVLPRKRLDYIEFFYAEYKSKTDSMHLYLGQRFIRIFIIASNNDHLSLKFTLRGTKGFMRTSNQDKLIKSAM